MENYKRADYNSRLSRYIKIFCFRFCGIFPMTGFFRAKIYKLLGVSIEKGVVRIGRVSIDTIHPEDIFIGKGTTITDGCILLSHYYDVRNLKEHAYYGVKFILGGMYISEAMPYSQNR